MSEKRLVDWPYVIALLVLPFAIIAVLFVIRFVQDFTRYDSQYFTEEYRSLYDTPSSVAFALEGALREGDEELMIELMGTRAGPGNLDPRPSLVFVFLYDREGDYLHYLYFNQDDYNRLIQFIKEEDGRYVASPEDLYFYIDSGRWQEPAGPLIAAWWILVIVATAMMFVYRYMNRYRESRYGG